MRKDQALAAAAAHLKCKEACIKAKQALWEARDQLYNTYADVGISCTDGETWDMADLASLLTTLSYRIQARVREYEAAAENAEEADRGP